MAKCLDRAVLATAALVVLSQPARAAEPTSRYTDYDLGACEERLVQEEGGFYEYDCPGLDGIGVFATEGDLRQEVDVGARNGRFDSFAGFNHLGPRVEWRLDVAGRPVAAIVRHLIDGYDDRGEPAKAEVLSVSTIGTAERPGCPIGYVDALANSDANVLARQVADHEAASFRCGVDSPRYVGAAGPVAGTAMAVRAD